MSMSVRMLPDAGVYDPDYPRMNIHPDHVPAYRSITALWNLLLSSDAHEPGCCALMQFPRSLFEV
jgi:hypothetical protein